MPQGLTGTEDTETTPSPAARDEERASDAASDAASPAPTAATTTEELETPTGMSTNPQLELSSADAESGSDQAGRRHSGASSEV